MNNALLVYQDNRLCCLQYEPWQDYPSDGRPYLQLWWWPLSQPTSRRRIFETLDWGLCVTGKEPEWDCAPVGSGHGTEFYYRSSKLPIVSVTNDERQQAIALGRIQIPRPKVKDDVELQWIQADSNSGYWRSLAPRGMKWKILPIFFKVTRPGDQYLGQFQQGVPEKYKPLGEPIVLEKMIEFRP